MKLVSEVIERGRALLFRSREERELDEELAFHIEMETQQNLRAGMNPEEARRRALLAFGGTERTREEVRDARGTRVVDDLTQDLRYALRQLGRNRGFAAVAVLTLGLGIGATTAIFSVMDAVLLRPLPFPNADRLMAVSSSPPIADEISTGVSFPDLREWAAGTRSFSSIGAYYYDQATVTGGVEPVLTDALAISSSLLPTLGVQPVLGRRFLPEDDRPGAPARVLLAYGLWQRLFGGDPGILGRAIRVNGAPFEVLGVLPKEFEFPPTLRIHDEWHAWSPGVYLPVGTVGEVDQPVAAFRAVGRLAPGTTPDQARAELAGIVVEQARRSGGAGEREARVVPLRKLVVGPLRPALLAFMGAVAIVLLIACANVAAILLGRFSARAHELTLRTALGAGRRRLLRQLLSESLVLALAGGVLGVFLAWAGLKLLLAAAPADLPRVHVAGLDARVLAFALVVSLGTGLVFGLFPALRASRTNLRGTLAVSRSVVSERRTSRAHGLLVAFQVGLAVVLLTGGGLLLRSFAELVSVDLGVATGRVFTMDVALPRDRYPERADADRFLDELDRRLAALPHVRAVSAVDRLPLGNSSSKTSLRIVGRPEPRPGEAPTALNNTARPGYFEAMGIPLVHGRTFDARDRGGPPWSP